MKIEVDCHVFNRITYPCLMVSKLTGNILLFKEDGVGTILYLKSDNSSYKIGHYSAGWDMAGFEEFKGEVKLAN